MDDHSLHDLEGSLHRGGVERILDMLLLDLDGLLILLVLHGLLHLLSLLVLVGLKIGIENHPLSGLKREVGADWRVGLDTLVSDGQVEGLR